MWFTNHHIITNPPEISLFAVETAPCDAADFLYRVRDAIDFNAKIIVCQVKLWIGKKLQAQNYSLRIYIFNLLFTLQLIIFLSYNIDIKQALL